MAGEDEPVKWISVAEAARILGVPVRSAYYVLQDPDRRAAKWGAEGEGWRRRPMSTKPNSYELSFAWVERLTRPPSSS